MRFQKILAALLFVGVLILGSEPANSQWNPYYRGYGYPYARYYPIPVPLPVPVYTEPQPFPVPYPVPYGVIYGGNPYPLSPNCFQAPVYNFTGTQVIGTQTVCP